MAEEGDGSRTRQLDISNCVPGLTEEERKHLISVMVKAKEFEAQEENKTKKPVEGLLSKYTNMVKGWQNRWFVLNPVAGFLEYYMVDEIKKRPRGVVRLAGAVISPSDEDSQTFTVSAVCGEVYRLRASDAKQRQFWVNRLRSAVENQNQHVAEKNPPLSTREQRSSSHPPPVKSQTVWHTSSCGSSHSTSVSTVISPVFRVSDAFNSVRELLLQTEHNHQDLVKTIEEIPIKVSCVKSYNRDLLLLKATSQATLLCLEQCFAILQQQQITTSSQSGLPAGVSVHWLNPSCSPGSSVGQSPVLSSRSFQGDGTLSSAETLPVSATSRSLQNASVVT
ncbi:oxysterol-binding protein-related protein 11-like isoform X1 [Tachypleus tridentatus]|uniref:oxysterol-binding protein-related protein 11-like isoform X1 n=2 Tax=Tachypleus tridentatus TaxID=6853 RepID=UPI003FD5381A